MFFLTFELVKLSIGWVPASAASGIWATGSVRDGLLASDGKIDDLILL